MVDKYRDKYDKLKQKELWDKNLDKIPNMYDDLD